MCGIDGEFLLIVLFHIMKQQLHDYNPFDSTICVQQQEMKILKLQQCLSASQTFLPMIKLLPIKEKPEFLMTSMSWERLFDVNNIFAVGCIWTYEFTTNPFFKDFAIVVGLQPALLDLLKK
jgi:hypothetical protein